MRFLGVTETCDLGALYIRLANAGHDVRVWVSHPLAQGTLAGIVPHVADWREELPWIRAAGDDGIIIFEAVSDGLGALQDCLRAEGYRVVGGSAFGDRLENDRALAQNMLADLGLSIAGVHEFADREAAAAFIDARPRRYVLKFCGPDFSSHDNYVGHREDGADVSAMLDAHRDGEEQARFILMDHVAGVEMGVGAYFDGTDFLEPACLDWEHKRFFAGDMGELTGEMGTVATFDRSRRFFARTLARCAPVLRAHRHVGYVNLNTIVNADGIWPLEFTCRFGYPGYAVLDPLQDMNWADLLRRMATGRGPDFSICPGFSVGVVMTTPPLPYSREEVAAPVGLPVMIDESFDAEDRRHLHYGEVGMRDGQLVTSGLYGWTMVVTGTGRDIDAARHAAYRRAAGVKVSNLRYRLDIGDRLIAQDYRTVEALGLLD